jgi:hypothetical protein
MGFDDLFADFQKFDFPIDASIVYVIGIRETTKGFFPFYVGESGRHIGRMGDYITANFRATTDFHVGEAIKFFHSKELSVEIRYKVSLERKDREKELIGILDDRGVPLQKLGSYHPKDTNEEDERKKVHEFCTRFLEFVRAFQ